MTIEDWRRWQYELEKEYARKFLLSQKGSRERAELFRLAYSDVIGNVIEHYNPGGGETQHITVTAAIVKTLLPSPTGRKIFDLGCGSGKLLAALAKDGYDAYGTDLSANSIKIGRSALSKFQKADHIRQEDFLDYVSSTTFDAIIMDNVIEHLIPDTVSDVLLKCYAMLKSEGFLIVLTPHVLSGPHDISKYFVPCGAKAEGFHLREYSFTDLDQCLRNSGFSEVFGFPFHPRLMDQCGLLPWASRWAAVKSMKLEKIAQRPLVRRMLQSKATFAKIATAFGFPAVAVGVKHRATEQACTRHSF